jgi:hypothetical protein
MKQSELNKRKTHCPAGHEYSPGNTVTRPDGRGNMARSCRECCRERDRLRDEKRREEAGLVVPGSRI